MAKKMTQKYITNIKIENGDTITFDLNNVSKEIKTSFANAIRRTIISDIKAYAIDERSISFSENTSVLDNEFLKLRLNLIPIVSDLEDVNYENLVISCKKRNDGENTESIYVSDFECRDIETDKVVDINALCKFPKILFSKIRNNQSIAFESRLTYHNSDHHGASYCVVGTCIYTFKVDETEVTEMTKDMSDVERIRFSTLDRERVYEKVDDGHPSVYQFVVESIGFYEPKKIVLMGMDCLIDNLTTLKNDMNVSDSKSERIELLTNESNFYDFAIDNETETLGNLISSYMTYDPNVFYCGFVIEHPLKKTVTLRIKLINDNTYENVIELISKYIDYFVDLINKMRDDIENGI
jgi:DNA-directed RNA polymerase subunit L